MKTKTRNIYIDVMKGLLICLVVIGHLPFFEYDSRTLTLIYSFHMHSFLIIGGILSHVDAKTKLSTIILKRLKGTLIPYFVFSIISLIFIPSPSPSHKIASAIAALRGIGDPINSINLPLWFLTFYFVAMTLFEIIEWFSYRVRKLLFSKSKSKVKNSYLFVAILTFIVVAALMYGAFVYARVYKLPRIPFNVEIAAFCIGFIFLGKILGTYIPLSFNEVKKSAVLSALCSILIFSLLVIFVFLWYTLSMKNGRIDLNARDYKNATLMYVNAILGFFSFAIISFLISQIALIKDFFGILGENSLYILAYHVPSVFFTNIYLMPLLPQFIITNLSQNSILSILILTGIGIEFSLILAFLHKSIHFRA